MLRAAHSIEVQRFQSDNDTHYTNGGRVKIVSCTGPPISELPKTFWTFS